MTRRIAAAWRGLGGPRYWRLVLAAFRARHGAAAGRARLARLLAAIGRDERDEAMLRAAADDAMRAEMERRTRAGDWGPRDWRRP